MNILFSDKAKRDYENLPEILKKTADKQLDFLVNDLRHPSLHAKKYEDVRLLSMVESEIRERHKVL